MSGNLAQNFGRVDYLMALPVILLTLFALGILLLDLLLPAQWKRVNALTALVGILFSAGGIIKIQLALNAAGLPGESAFLNAMVVDRFTISATHTGSVNGIAPTGQKIDALGMHMWRLTNGKLAEGWYLTDAMPMVAAALVPSP